jgi:uncharacterized protein (TIGR02996 family)
VANPRSWEFETIEVAKAMNSDDDLDERHFLRAVLAAPDDDADLLVAADWLQDRSEPAAELIRLCRRLAEEGSGRGRGEMASRVRLLIGQVLERDVDDRLDLLPVAVALPRGRRKTGDEYRLVGRAVQTRPGRGRWIPCEGDPPPEVAR